MRLLELKVTEKQRRFIYSNADETLFGGAAGGGKSYGQVIDALLYALRYSGSKQIIFRRSYPELEKSIIRTMLEIYPADVFVYNVTKHVFRFCNGSVIDCGYIAEDKDVYQYQSAEYDVIRFDELTHFSRYVYTYMLSRLRGANDYPKYVKSSTNPTGVGRVWVKERFVDIGEAEQVHRVTIGTDSEGRAITQTRVFIPSKVYDNVFLLSCDPSYVDRLMCLDESERRGLLEGEWDYFDGQYFAEFRRELHTITPFRIDPAWRIYRAIDYGLDMLACYWIAVDNMRRAYVFREFCHSDLPISVAAKEILSRSKEPVYLTLAPPDLWSRSQETGRSKADIFAENGLVLTRSGNDREAGWLCIKELLQPDSDGESRIRIFTTCPILISHLPQLMRDPIYPTDCATIPHEITHSPDALRYFAIYWTQPSAPPRRGVDLGELRRDQREDYLNADKQQKEVMRRKWGL